MLDTFPIVKKRDEQEHGGHYRTKDTMLEIYDAMAEASRTGVPYRAGYAPGRPMHRLRIPRKVYLCSGSLE